MSLVDLAMPSICRISSGVGGMRWTGAPVGSGGFTGLASGSFRGVHLFNVLVLQLHGLNTQGQTGREVNPRPYSVVEHLARRYRASVRVWLKD